MCFMGTEMDVLVVGNYMLYKDQQDETLKENYEERYELDQTKFSKTSDGTDQQFYWCCIC